MPNTNTPLQVNAKADSIANFPHWLADPAYVAKLQAEELQYAEVNIEFTNIKTEDAHTALRIIEHMLPLHTLHYQKLHNGEKVTLLCEETEFGIGMLELGKPDNVMAIFHIHHDKLELHTADNHCQMLLNILCWLFAIPYGMASCSDGKPVLPKPAIYKPQPNEPVIPLPKQPPFHHINTQIRIITAKLTTYTWTSQPSYTPTAESLLYKKKNPSAVTLLLEEQVEGLTLEAQLSMQIKPHINDTNWHFLIFPTVEELFLRSPWATHLMDIAYSTDPQIDLTQIIPLHTQKSVSYELLSPRLPQPWT